MENKKEGQEENISKRTSAGHILNACEDPEHKPCSEGWGATHGALCADVLSDKLNLSLSAGVHDRCDTEKSNRGFYHLYAYAVININISK